MGNGGNRDCCLKAQLQHILDKSGRRRRTASLRRLNMPKTVATPILFLRGMLFSDIEFECINTDIVKKVWQSATFTCIIPKLGASPEARTGRRFCSRRVRLAMQSFAPSLLLPSFYQQLHTRSVESHFISLSASMMSQEKIACIILPSFGMSGMRNS